MAATSTVSPMAARIANRYFLNHIRVSFPGSLMSAPVRTPGPALRVKVGFDLPLRNPRPTHFPFYASPSARQTRFATPHLDEDVRSKDGAPVEGRPACAPRRARRQRAAPSLQCPRHRPLTGGEPCLELRHS